ncbi:hypothetical protein LINPERPRIM_LOCUS23186 [Linum perenne]
MEDDNRSVGGNENRWLWWGVGSTALMGWGVFSWRRGYAGDGSLMPLKAFAVASLFVGSAASASFCAIRASGIHKQVEDLVQVGADLRTQLGIPSRPHHKRRD